MDASPPDAPTPRERYEQTRTSIGRARTFNEEKLRHELRRHAEDNALSAVELLNLPPRPRVRGDCERGLRPCPWVSCKYHLYVDVDGKNGSMKMNFPDLEPWDLSETCALDVADSDGTTLEDVGLVMNLTRERVRQLETAALVKLATAARDDAAKPRRRLPLLDRETLAELDSFTHDQLDEA